MSRRSLAALAALACSAALAASASAPPAPPPPSDVAAARAVFARNLDAIRRHDRAAYLACYLESDSLARTGPTGFRLGFGDLERESGTAWPDGFEAMDLHLTPVRGGLVYGTYRYRVRYGDDVQAGLSERLFVNTPRGWRIAVTTAFAAPPGTPPPPRALVGATLLDGTGRPPVRDAVVVLREGKIECAGPRASCPVPAGVDTLDLRGLWLTPGLVDAHVHYSQTGWADGRPDALDLRARYPYDEVQRQNREHPERWHRSYLCCGVTAVFDVGGFPWTLDLEQRTRNDPEAPHVVAAGPLLSTLDFWLNLPGERQFIYLSGDSAARAGVRYLAARGSSAVKVWFIPNTGRPFEEMEKAVAAAGDEARRARLPLIVHATGLKEAKAALRAGAKLLVHSVWDVPVDEEFLSLAKHNGTIYCPTITVADGYARLYAAARAGAAGAGPRIDDPCGCVDSLTRAHVASTGAAAREMVEPSLLRPVPDFTALHRVMALNLKRVHDAGIPIAMGTDAGNPLTLHGPSVFAEMEAMQAAGLTPGEVLTASTRGGALAMGRLAELGTVEPGKAADLLVVGADPTRSIANLRKVRYVVRAGVVHPAAGRRPEKPGAR